MRHLTRAFQRFFAFITLGLAVVAPALAGDFPTLAYCDNVSTAYNYLGDETTFNCNDFGESIGVPLERQGCTCECENGEAFNFALAKDPEGANQDPERLCLDDAYLSDMGVKCDIPGQHVYFIDPSDTETYGAKCCYYYSQSVGCIDTLNDWKTFLDEHYTELELELGAEDGAYVGDDYAVHKCPGGRNEDETENNLSPCKCDYDESTFDVSDGKCKYVVRLDKNGGSGMIQGNTGTQNASVQCTEGESCLFGSASGLSQTGYTFLGGWGTSQNCTETTYSFTNPTGTYYACKNANGYEITLNKTSATGGTTKIYTTYNTNVYLDSGRTQKMTTTTNPVTKPTLSNATFLGYYNSASGTTQYINADGYITSAGISAAKSVSGNNISWYAKWQTQASTVTITLSDGTGVTGGSGSISVVGGVKYLNGQQMTTNSNPVAVPAKSNGLAFLGYYNSASGTTQYIDENGYITTAGINASISGTTTWHARFSTSCVVINLDNTTYCDTVGNLPERLYYSTSSCGNNSCSIYTNAGCTTQFTGFNSNSLPSKTNATFMGYASWRDGGKPGVISNTGALTYDVSDYTVPYAWKAICSCNAGMQGNDNVQTTIGNATSDACARGATIVLNNNEGYGSDAIYTNASGVYLGWDHTLQMTTGANCSNQVNIPVKTVNGINYTFLGYFATATGGTKYIDEDGCLTTNGNNAGKAYQANQTWYAQWATPSYTVTYAAGDGGSGSMNPSTAYAGVIFTASTPSANTIHKDNATFQSWTVSNTGTTPTTWIDGAVWNYTENKTFTAQWACNPGFGYNSTTHACEPCAAGKYKSGTNNNSCTNINAGYFSTGCGTTATGGVCNSNLYDGGVCVSGYSSAGTGTSSSCTACASGYSASGDTSAYHDNVNDCKTTIRLNKNGGSGTIQDVGSTTNSSIQCSQGASCDFGSAIGLTQTGYTFKTGWGTSQNCTETTYSFTNPTGTYYACKTANKYTVNLDRNNTNATAGTQSVEATYDSPMPAIETLPTLANQTFVGYYDAATDGTQYYDGNGASVRNWDKDQTNPTLYAHWSQNVATITLNKNGNDVSGTCGGASGKITCNAGGTCTLPQWDATNCNIENGTKIFVGWATTANATSGTFTISNAQTQIYYAIWRDTVCDISNGSGAATTPTNNAPNCDVTCNNGYSASENAVSGTAGNPSVSSSDACVLNQYTVTFKTGNTVIGTMDVNHGENTQLKSYSSMTSAVPDALKSNEWGFVGWNTTYNKTTKNRDDAGTYAFTDNATLYGIWKRNVPYEYYASNGNLSSETLVQYYRNTDAITGAPKQITLPSSSLVDVNGWNAMGWVDSTTSTETIATAQTPAYNSAMPTYRALYSRNAKIAYDGNNSTSGTTSSDIQSQYFAAGYGAHELEFTLANNGFARTGFDFGGWMLGNNTNGTTKNPGDKIIYENTAFDSADSYSVFAMWEPKTIELRFLESGHGSIDPIQCSYGETVVLPLPTDNGYMFSHWETPKGSTFAGGVSMVCNETNLGADAVNNGVAQINAHWTQNQYRVTVNAGRGISAVSGNGWTIASNGKSMYKDFAYNDSIDFNSSNFRFSVIGGYNESLNYSKGTSDAGTLTGSMFTVGLGVATITVASTGVVTPTVTLGQQYENMTYNSAETNTLTTTTSAYDTNAFDIKYAFGETGKSTSSACGVASYTYGNFGTTNTKIVSAQSYLGYKCYTARVQVCEKNTSSCVTATSNAVSNGNLQRTITFNNGGSGTTVSGANTGYARYGTSTLYNTNTGDTEITVPWAYKSATPARVFTGWYTQSTNGTQVYNATGTLQPSVADYTNNSSKWIVTDADGKNLYPHFENCSCTNGTNVASCTVNTGTLPKDNNNKCSYTYTCVSGYKTGTNSATSGTFDGAPGVGANTSPACGATPYSITYELNDGEATGTYQTSAMTDEVFQVTPPEHPHGTFNGWTISGMDTNQHEYGATSSLGSSSTAQSLDVGATIKYFKNLRKSSGTVTFTAKWTCATGYNNGNNCAIQTITCSAGQYLPKNTVTCANCPAGKYCEGGAYTFNTTQDQGITGTCAANTYSAGGASTSSCAACATNAHSSAGAISCTCNTGYSINGGTSSTTVDTANDPSGSNCALRSYKITLNKNGGTGLITIGSNTFTGTNSAEVLCQHGIACDLPVYNSTTGNLSKGTNADAKIFLGWSDTRNTNDNATSAQFKTSYTATGTKTLYAVWGTPTCTKGTGVATTSLNGVSGNAPVCNRTSTDGYYCSGTQTGNAGSLSLTTTCTQATAGHYAAAGATSQSNCGNGKYSGAGASSCTNCPSLSDWTIHTTTDTATSSSACYATRTPENCHSGTIKRTASNSTAYNTTVSVTVALTANAGYYVNGTACSACATGASSATGATQCTACQNGTTTNGTAQSSCNATCPNSTGVSAWATATWNASDNTVSNLCTPGSMSSYTVTLNDNEGSGGPTSVNAEYGSAMPTITTLPTRVGYTFAGYWDEADGGTQYYNANGTSARSWNKTNDAILYAHWNIMSYSITISAGRGIATIAQPTNGGWTGSGTAILTKTVEYGTTIDLSEFTPTRKAGYTGTGYTVTGAGNLDGSTFTVGANTATITISATGISTPSTPTITGGATKIFNLSNTTLTGNVSDFATNYDTDTIQLEYSFGYTTNSSGTPTDADWDVVSGNTKSIAKDLYHGTRYYRTRVCAKTADGALKSDYVVSSTTTMKLLNRTITFDATTNGGTLSGTGTLYVAYQLPNSTTSLYSSSTGTGTKTVPTATKSDYIFKGWYTAATGGYQVYNANGVLQPGVANYTDSSSKWIVTGNKKLYAQFDVSTGTQYTVNYYTEKLDDTVYELESSIQGSGTTDATLILADLASARQIDGFTYSAGYVDNSNPGTRPTSTAPTTTTIVGNRVINLYYTRNSYEVSETHGTGITGVTGAGSYLFGASVTLTPTVSDGYTFENWTDNNNSNAQVSTDATYTFTMPANDVSYRANATPNSYNITLNKQSGTGGTSSVSVTYGYTMPAITRPTRGTYTFGGYYTGTSGSGTQYYNADGTSAKAWAETNVTTLYAKWTACTACAPGNGANCTLTVSNNTCTYETSCKTGYSNIQNNGKYNPSCTPNTINITLDKNGGTGICGGVSGVVNGEMTCTYDSPCNAPVYGALPAGYTGLEYITFDGTYNTGAYIDTGLKYYTDIPNNEIRIVADAKIYQHKTNSSWQVVAGNLGAASAYIGTNSSNYLYYAVGVNDTNTNVKNPYQRLLFDLNAPAKTLTIKNIATNANIVNLSNISVEEQPTDLSIMIGGFTSSNKSLRKERAYMDLYRVKIYKDGVLKFDGVPAKYGNTVGLYDLVSNTFKTSANSTQLTAGPGKVTCEITNGTNILTGWTKSNGDVVALGGDITNITTGAATTLTAQWDQCAPCNTANANSVNCSIDVIDNQCVWTTSCKDGYSNIQNPNTPNASCTGNTITLNWTSDSRGTISNAPATCVYGSTFTAAKMTANAGYEFDKWSVNEKTFGSSETNVPCTQTQLGIYSGTATITPNFNTNKYNLSYNCNGGTAQSTLPATTSVSYGASYTTAANTVCTRTGYTLSGWMVGGTSSTDVKNTGEEYQWTYTADKTLYAKWTANVSGKITLNSNRFTSNTSTNAAQTATSASNPAYVYTKYNTGVYKDSNATTEITQLTSIPKMTGYTFTGFWTQKYSGGTQVTDSDGKFLAAAKTVITGTTTATWYARWSKCTDCDPGTGASCELSVENNACTYRTSCDAGYHGPNTNTPSVPANNGAYNPSCTGNTIGLSWNANGHGNNPSSPATCTYGSTFTTPTMTSGAGYNFSGWKNPNNQSFTGNTEYNCDYSNLGTYTDSVAFAAQWNEATYIVTYACGDGTGDAPTNGTPTYNSPFTPAANTCTRTGYTFAGWLVTGTSDTKPAGTSFTWTYTEDKTFTAQWSADSFKVRYAKSPAAATGTTPADSTCIYGNASSCTAAANPYTYTGHTFDGWACSLTNGGGTCAQATYAAGADISGATVPGGDITLTPTWDANRITLEWDNDGHGTLPSGRPTECYYGSTFTMPAAMSATGYTFNGWEINSTTYAAGATVDCTMATSGTVTITGSWTEKQYTIALDNQGGTGATSVAGQKYGNAMNVVTPPTRTGYTFVGYFDATTGGNMYYKYNGTSFRTWNKDQTSPKLYAHWSANPYTVTFNGNGGTGGTQYTTAIYGKPMPTVQPNLADPANGAIIKYNGCASGKYPYGASTTGMYNVFLRVEPNTTYMYTDNTGDRQAIYEYNFVVNPDSYTSQGQLSPDRTINGYGTTEEGLSSNCFTTGANAKMVMLYLKSTSGATPTNLKIYKVVGATCTHSTVSSYSSASAGVLSSGGTPLTPDAQIEKPTKSNETFNGYFDATTGGNQYYTAGVESNKNWDKASDATLYAQYKSMTVNVSGKSLTYNGTAQSCAGGATVAFPLGATITYSSSQNGSYTATAPTLENVSQSPITVYFKATATGYNDYYGNYQCTMAKATMTPSLAGNSKVYDGTALTCDGGEQTGVPASSTITYRTGTTGNYGNAPTVTAVADSKTVYYKITNANYNDFTGSFSCGITNAELAAPTTPTNHLVYNGTTPTNGTAQNCPGVTGVASGASVQYSTTEDGTYVASTPTIKNAGETTVWYKLTKTNYNDKIGSYTCTLDTKAMTVNATDKSLIYNGTAQSCAGGVTVSDPSSGATIEYTDTMGVTYSTTAPTLTNVGSKTIYYQVTAGNYTTNTGSYTCAMTTANSQLALSATSGSVTYPTTTGTFTVTTNTSGGALSVASSDESVATATISGTTITITYHKAGTANITVTSAATGNYTAQTATYVATANNKIININNNSGSGTCLGGNITCTYTNTNDVPSMEYTELDYLQSDGNQWIDTEISGFNSGNWEIYAKWMLIASTQPNSYANIVSVYNDESTNSYRIITNGTNSTAYYVSGNSKAGGGSVLISNKPINQIHTATVKNGSVIFDGTTISTTTKGTALPSSKVLGIFSHDGVGKAVAKIYSVTVSKDGVMQAKFVPVKRISDGVLGMYDTVRGKFFTNAGTGTFTQGNEKSGGTCNAPVWGDNSRIPAEYTEVAYIQSTGSQYIDTGYKPNTNTELTGKILATTASKYVYGVHPSSNTNTFSAYTHGNWRFSNKKLTVNASIFSLNTDYTIKQNKTGIWLNDTSVGTYSSPTSFTADYNLYLFAANTGTGKSYGTGIRIYNLQIKDNGVLVRDFVPVKRNSDNKYGLFDTVNRVFYPNSNTSGANFSAGATVASNDVGGTCEITNGTKVLTGWNTAANGTGTAVTLGQNNIGTLSANTLYAVWGTPNCSVTNGTGTATTSVNNSPVCNVTCSAGYSKLGYMDATTTGFTTSGNPNQTSASYTCAARTYRVELDAKRYTSASASDGTAPENAGTATYWYRYKTNSPCYYYSTELQSAADEVAANCIAGTNGDTITVPSGMSGYNTFGGYWTGKTGTGTQYVLNTGVTTNQLWNNVANDSTLYAKWNANTFNVGYSSDVPSSTTPTSCTYGATCNAPTATAVTKTGYTLSHWTCAASSGVCAKTSYAPGESISTATTVNAATITLTAVWTPNISGKITLDVNRYASASATNATQTATSNPAYVYTKYNTGVYSNADATTKITKLSSVPTMVGYNFGGLYTDKYTGGTQVANSSGTFLSAANTRVATTGGTATWYAHWTAKQSVLTFDENEGTGTTKTVTATYGSAMPSVAGQLPTRAGYTFVGYFDATSGGNQYYKNDGTSFQNWNKNTTASTTLYARWTPNSYTVTLNKNTSDNDTTPVDTVNATFGAAMPVVNASGNALTIPTNSNQIITGYADARSNGVLYYNINGMNITSAKNWDKTTDNTTLYAQWETCALCNATNASCILSVVNNECHYETSCEAGYHGLVGDGTATPSCTANTYTVQFTTGNNVVLGTQEFTYGESKKLTEIENLDQTKIPVSSANGWMFWGWNKNFGNPLNRDYTDGATVSESLTTENGAIVKLYGVWTRNVSFKYYSPASATAISTNTKQQQYYNSAATAAGVKPVAKNPLVTHSTYNWVPQGWVLGSTSSTTTVTNDTTNATITPAHNIGTSNGVAYYALYKRPATIQYNVNGGTGSVSDTTADQYFNAGGTNSVPLNMTLATGTGLSKTNYSFAGWTQNQDGTGASYESGANYTFPATSWKTTQPSVTLYANWSQNTAVCSAGQYLPANATACTQCPEGSYCPGGTYNLDNAEHGRNTCPSGYTSDAGNASQQTQCYVNCGPGQYKASTTSICENVGVKYWGVGGKSFYGDALEKQQCGMMSMPNDDGTWTDKQLQTTGSDLGANEAADCGRVLHVGNYSLRLRSGDAATPSLRFDFTHNGVQNLLWAKMTTTQKNMSAGSAKKFKMNYQNQTYYVCDDTTCAN